MTKATNSIQWSQTTDLKGLKSVSGKWEATVEPQGEEFWGSTVITEDGVWTSCQETMEDARREAERFIEEREELVILRKQVEKLEAMEAAVMRAVTDLNSGDMQDSNTCRAVVKRLYSSIEYAPLRSRISVITAERNQAIDALSDLLSTQDKCHKCSRAATRFAKPLGPLVTCDDHGDGQNFDDAPVIRYAERVLGLRE